MGFRIAKIHYFYILLLFVAFLRREDVFRTFEMMRLKFIAFLDNDYVEYRDSISVFSQELQLKFIAETQNVWQKINEHTKAAEEAFASGSVTLKTALDLQWLEINNFFGGKYEKLITSLKADPDYHVEFTEIFTSKGYPIERHYLTTADGYILQLFRVQARGQKGMNVFKKPVLLNHGIFCGGDVWVSNGEKLSPAFILANSGYDVWIGNARGNQFGRNHTWLNPDKDNDFWDFTWQHMALYDVPDSIQYIYSITHQPVSIIGHSQGALTILGMLASDVEGLVKPMLGKVFLLGPVMFMKNLNHDIVRATMEMDLNWFVEKLGVQEFAIPKRLLGPVLVYFCYFFSDLCGDLVQYLSDTDPSLVNANRVYVFTGRYPQGTSIKSILHFRQMILAGDYVIKYFDYGPALNEIRYGTKIPPVLDLSSITTHLYVFGGLQDKLTNIEDIREGVKRLPSVTYQEIDAGHLSFLLGNNMSYIYTIMDAIEKDEPAQQIMID